MKWNLFSIEICMQPNKLALKLDIMLEFTQKSYAFRCWPTDSKCNFIRTFQIDFRFSVTISCAFSTESHFFSVEIVLRKWLNCKPIGDRLPVFNVYKSGTSFVAFRDHWPVSLNQVASFLQRPKSNFVEATEKTHRIVHIKMYVLLCIWNSYFLHRKKKWNWNMQYIWKSSVENATQIKHGIQRESNNFETFHAYKNIWIYAGWGNDGEKDRKERKREWECESEREREEEKIALKNGAKINVLK